MYIYIFRSQECKGISHQPRPVYFCGLNIVSLEHRFSGCCLLAFGDPKAALHDLRNKKGSLFLKRHVLKKHKEKGFQKNSPHKIFQYYSLYRNPIPQDHYNDMCLSFCGILWGLHLAYLSLCLGCSPQSGSPADVGWIFNQQHNKIMRKWNEWWERVTLETHKNLLVATELFLEFSPRKLGRSSNLTSIFFRWVGSTTN